MRGAASMAMGLVELALASGGRLVRGMEGAPTGVSIDTRSLAPGDLFVALRGPNRDGHAFVAAALEGGAWGAVVEEGFAPPGDRGAIVAVADTTLALQEMGRARRTEMAIPFVGVTGSVGKTTTKEMIAQALSAGHRVTKSAGNLNNHLGVPLSLLRAPADATAAVYELGMSAPGEIAFLAKMVRPRIGVVTNVAEVHLETMGSLEAIAAAKSELVAALPRDGVALLNWDDDLVREMAGQTRAEVLSFGFSEGARLRAIQVELDERGTVFVVAGGGPVRIPAWGRHLVYAGLAAIGCSELLGVPATAARDALLSFRPASGRSAARPLGRIRLVDDSYNASPASVRAAVLALCERPGSAGRWAALGDMLELGPRAEAIHDELGRWLAERPLAGIHLYGPLAAAVRRGAIAAGMAPERAPHFADREELADALADRLAPGDFLLVKGSRGMAMEAVIARLEARMPASRWGVGEPEAGC